jgi:hypothetical protein
MTSLNRFKKYIKLNAIYLFCIILISSLAGFSFWQNYQLNQQIKSLSDEKNSLLQKNENTQSDIKTNTPDKKDLYLNLAKKYNPEQLSTSSNFYDKGKFYEQIINYSFSNDLDGNGLVSIDEQSASENGSIRILYPKKFKLSSFGDLRFDSYNSEPDENNYKTRRLDYYFVEIMPSIADKTITKSNFMGNLDPNENGKCEAFTKFEMAYTCTDFPLGGEASITKILEITKGHLQLHLQIDSSNLSPDEEKAIFDSIRFN